MPANFDALSMDFIGLQAALPGRGRPWQVLVVLLRRPAAGPNSGGMKGISVAGLFQGFKKGQDMMK